MNELTSTTYRFAQAARILGLTPKQLRYLVKEIGKEVGMTFEHDAERKGPQWYRLSLLDIFRLTLIRVLMAYGAEAPKASEIALGAMNGQLLAAYKNVPASVLVGALTNKVLIVSRSGDDWPWDIITLRVDTDSSRGTIGVVDLTKLPDVAIIVKLGPLAESVLKRVEDHGEGQENAA